VAHHSIGVAYFNLDNYAESRRSLDSALHIYEQTLGLNHPDALDALGVQALVLYELGDVEEAGDILEEVFLSYEMTFGMQNPKTAKACQKLAEFCSTTQSFRKASALFRRAMRSTQALLINNLRSITEAERFKYLNTQTGLEPLLLNLAAMQGAGPKKVD
jgi:tetratricopeptide (TPR) repeat protein